MAVRARRGRVCLVDDQRVPCAADDSGEHLGPLHVVCRGHHDRVRRPGIDADRQLRQALPHLTRVQHDGVERESFLELVDPLVPETGRRDDEHLVGRAARSQLGDDQPGLDRLAKADLVGDEDTRAHSPRDRQSRLELVREQCDVSRPGRAQGFRAAGIGNQRAKPVLPPMCRTPPGRNVLVNLLNAVERCDEPSLDAEVRTPAPVSVTKEQLSNACRSATRHRCWRTRTRSPTRASR